MKLKLLTLELYVWEDELHEHYQSTRVVIKRVRPVHDIYSDTYLAYMKNLSPTKKL